VKSDLNYARLLRFCGSAVQVFLTYAMCVAPLKAQIGPVNSEALISVPSMISGRVLSYGGSKQAFCLYLGHGSDDSVLVEYWQNITMGPKDHRRLSLFIPLSTGVSLANGDPSCVAATDSLVFIAVDRVVLIYSVRDSLPKDPMVVELPVVACKIFPLSATQFGFICDQWNTLNVESKERRGYVYYGVASWKNDDWSIEFWREFDPISLVNGLFQPRNVIAVSRKYALRVSRLADSIIATDCQTQRRLSLKVLGTGVDNYQGYLEYQKDLSWTTQPQVAIQRLGKVYQNVTSCLNIGVLDDSTFIVRWSKQEKYDSGIIHGRNVSALEWIRIGQNKIHSLFSFEFPSPDAGSDPGGSVFLSQHAIILDSALIQIESLNVGMLSVRSFTELAEKNDKAASVETVTWDVTVRHCFKP